MNVEKEATLRAAKQELYPDNMPRVRKAKCLDFGDEDTSIGNKNSGYGNPNRVIKRQRLISH